MIKFYCEQCKNDETVIIESMKSDELNKDAWGDVVCKKCHFVIATLFVDEPGEYDFVKVKDIS